MILKQWEYKIVSDISLVDVNILNEFGFDEWELCAVINNPLSYIFKRSR